MHKARLKIYFGTGSDGNIARASCGTAAEVVQQTLAGLGFSSIVCDMSHSTESVVAIGYHLHDVERTFGQEYLRGLLL